MSEKGEEMRTFMTMEVRDFSETIIDQSTIQAVIQWVSDNLEPEEVYDKERLLDYARGYLTEDSK